MKTRYFFLFLILQVYFPVFGQIPKPLTVTTFTDLSYTDTEPTIGYDFDFPMAADILTANPATHVPAFDNRYFMSAYGPRHKQVATSNIGFFDFHKGSDMTSDIEFNGTVYDENNPPGINCICDGEIHEIFTGPNPELTGTGMFVTVKCDDDFAANGTWGNIYTAYRHLSVIEPTLMVGGVISKGDNIGVMGATGFTTTVHLHFSVIRRNTGSEINVHPMRIFSPTAAPHLINVLNTAEITQLEHSGTEALFRIAIPHNQANIRAIEVTLQGGDYTRIYDYETISLLPEEDRDDNNIISGLELFAYPFNRGHELYRRIWERYFDGQITDDYPASPDFGIGNFFPYLSEGLHQTPAYGMDLKVTGLPNGFNPANLNIKIIDIWGYGVTANGIAQPTDEHFAWTMINEENDDAEEYDTGTMSLDSPDLEMVFDDSHGNQTVGFRFENLNIPKDVTLTQAWLQFRADESHSGATDLNFKVENTNNPNPFSINSDDLSDRITTNKTVMWNPNPWIENEMGAAQKLTGLATQIQDLVSLPNWDNSSALTYLVTGTGRRTAEHYDLDDWWRNAYLYLEYSDALFLPIELTDFYGEIVDKTNVLRWDVATQKDVAWMILERLADDSNWEEIGRVAGELTNNTPNSYKIMDAAPLNLSYYRLRILDINGAEQLSKIIHILRNKEAFASINIAPNPSASFIIITLDELKNADYTIYSSDGQTILTGIIEYGTAVIDLQELQEGIYFLKIETEEKVTGFEKIFKF
jgi:murein DD-endopeptidase MepM/ murein hydrolase activator NlpD